jgi:hypothetical protein
MVFEIASSLKIKAYEEPDKLQMTSQSLQGSSICSSYNANMQAEFAYDLSIIPIRRVNEQRIWIDPVRIHSDSLLLYR